MRPKPEAFVLKTFSTWSEVFAAVLVSEIFKSPVVTFFALVFISTRQNLLGLLVHEQAHRLCSPQKWADHFTNFLAGFWIGMPVQNYRSIHLSHHAYYFSKRDPDLHRKHGEFWRFPKTRGELLKLFVKDLSGLSLIQYIRGKNRATLKLSPQYQSSPKTKKILKLSFYLWLIGLVTVLYFTGQTTNLLFYWVLPAATFSQVIVRWGALLEHQYEPPIPNLERSTPFAKFNRLERWLLPNLNFNYHLYHHYYPYIPGSELPKVHAIHVAEGLVHEDAAFRGHWDYFDFLTNPQHRFRSETMTSGSHKDSEESQVKHAA